jgi:hypothetical protein
MDAWYAKLLHHLCLGAHDFPQASSSTNDPVIHFLLFVPAAHHRPMQVVDSDGELSDPGVNSNNRLTELREAFIIERIHSTPMGWYSDP